MRIGLKAVLIGAVIGGATLFLFGGGWPMALYLAGEGIVLGAVVGALSSLTVRGARRH